MIHYKLSMANLIIVTGVPAAGKTSITKSLSAKFMYPALIKDRIREELFDSLGYSDRKRSKQYSVAAMNIIFAQAESFLKNGVSCIIDNAFKSEQHNERISKLKEATGCNIIQILCKGDGAILFERYRKRALLRHKGYCDLETFDEIGPIVLKGRAEPLGCVGKLLEFDTTFINDALIEQIIGIVAKEINFVNPS